MLIVQVKKRYKVNLIVPFLLSHLIGNSWYNFSREELLMAPIQCVESVGIRSYSGPYFPAFGLNTERYGVSLRIQSECEKIRTRITPNTDTFCAAYLTKPTPLIIDLLVLLFTCSTNDNLLSRMWPMCLWAEVGSTVELLKTERSICIFFFFWTEQPLMLIQLD